MTNTKCPCGVSCPDRSPTCHASCAAYIAYATEKAKEYARNAAEKGKSGNKTIAGKKRQHELVMRNKRRGKL